MPQNISNPTFALPTGYCIEEDSVYYLEENKDGETEKHRICSLIKVLALTRDSNYQEWGRLLEITDPDGRTKTWAMPMSLLAGSGEDLRRQLLSLGVQIAGGYKARNHLSNFLARCNPSARARCVARCGWHGSVFVLPDSTYGNTSDEIVILQTASPENPYSHAGTLDEWQESIGELCQGNSILTFSVSCALAAPLLDLAGVDSGGFNLVGDSSTGKTTALQVAGSVCGGGGLKGFIRQWRTTDNGLEAIAAIHCDNLLCLDEMGQASGKVVSEAAYMLANGQGKSRAKLNGISRKPQEWRTLFLSTGEVGLADKICEDQRTRVQAGQQVRVVDIPADAGMGMGIFQSLHHFDGGDELARYLKRAVSRCYGTPLRRFLEVITQNPSLTHKAIIAQTETFSARAIPPGADGQVIRVANRFDLVASAGEIALHHGVLPWSDGDAQRAVLECFNAWLNQRGGVGSLEIKEGISQVRAFFETHGSSRFADIESKLSQVIPNQAGYRKRIQENVWFYTFPSCFRQEVCAGFNHKKLCRELIARSILDTDHSHFTKLIRTPDGRKRLFAINATLLCGDTGDSGDPSENIISLASNYS